jgi:hypothetical protein
MWHLFLSQLQLPLFHKLTEKEEHAARILQLENKVEEMQKQIDRLNVYTQSLVGNPDQEVSICHVDGVDYYQFAKKDTKKACLDFDQLFRGKDKRSPKKYDCSWKIYQTLMNFNFLKEFEILHYNDTDLQQFFYNPQYGGDYPSNTVKTIKVTNCPKLKKFDIPKSWWSTKTLIVENCPDLDFEYFFDGKQRNITTIILADKSDRLMERYSRRLQEIGISLRF